MLGCRSESLVLLVTLEIEAYTSNILSPAKIKTRKLREWISSYEMPQAHCKLWDFTAHALRNDVKLDVISRRMLKVHRDELVSLPDLLYFFFMKTFSKAPLMHILMDICAAHSTHGATENHSSTLNQSMDWFWTLHIITQLFKQLFSKAEKTCAYEIGTFETISELRRPLQ